MQKVEATPRELAFALKRERIIEEATELFHERGFERTTIDAIAARFGMTKPSIYYHFPSKTDLLEAVCLKVIQECVKAIDVGVLSEGTVRRRLSMALDCFVRAVIRLRASTAIYFREEKHFSPEGAAESFRNRRLFDKKLSLLIEEGIKVGEFDVADARFASLAIGGMVSWLYVWYQPGHRLTEDEVVARMVDASLKIVGAPKE